MLTAELVDVKRKGGELLLRPFDAALRAEAHVIASALLETARASVGARREDVEPAWAAAAGDDSGPARRKLVLGLMKLVEDACAFEPEVSTPPEALRRELFRAATTHRRERLEGSPFSRDEVLAKVAQSMDLTPAAVERGLFSDLRQEHVLRAAPDADAPALVESYALGRMQAILLCATRVTCDVTTASAGPLRAFFAKLKFHKLLFSAERVGKGYRVVIDGPLSMFESVTRYGLRLALLVPALRELDAWSLTAELRWGKARDALVFRMTSADDEGAAAKPRKRASRAHLSDDVRALLDGIAAQKTGFIARPTTTILDVPGVGLCIPDLELKRPGDTAPVYVEVLGFWSRDAVWRRVELAEQGAAGAKIVFAVSAHLRVSEDVLGEETAGAALYVYKNKMSARALLERVTRIADRPA